MVSEQFRIIWLAYQGHDPNGYCLSEKCTKKVDTFAELVDNWVARVLKLIESDLKTFRSVLETWRPPLPEEAHFYSHETDGRFTTLEMLRRATFNEWFVDVGLLRASLRSGLLPVGSSVADLGAGTGEYVRWLNDTGLVDAFSYDGSADIELLTKKKVTHLNLVGGELFLRCGQSLQPTASGLLCCAQVLVLRLGFGSRNSENGWSDGSVGVRGERRASDGVSNSIWEMLSSSFDSIPPNVGSFGGVTDTNSSGRTAEFPRRLLHEDLLKHIHVDVAFPSRSCRFPAFSSARFFPSIVGAAPISFGEKRPRRRLQVLAVA